MANESNTGSSSHPNDDALVLAVREGQPGLFDLLIQRYERRIFSFILRMVSQAQDAEELTQDCFVRAFYALDNCQPQGRFASWLFTIAGNLVRTHLKNRSRAGKNLSLDRSTPELGREDKHHENGPDVQQSLDKVPEKYRVVLILKYVDSLSCREISEIEGINEDTVRQRLHRGREILREFMSPFPPSGSFPC